MADDILIRIGDGVTQEWVLSPSNTGLVSVKVDGVAVAYTQPTWNKVRLAVAPVAGAKVSFTFTETVPGGAPGGSVSVDLTPISQAIAGVQSTVDTLASQPASGAVSGEVKLFALANGQAVPAGWIGDNRSVASNELPVVAIAPAYVPPSSYGASGMCAVQVGSDTYTLTAAGNVVRSQVFNPAAVFSVSTPVAYGQGALPMTCSLLGKLCLIGGGAGSSPKANVYETDGQGIHTALNALPAARTNGSAIELPGGRVLVVGGQLGISNFSNELLVFTRGVGWQTLTTEALDEAVLWPHLAKLPSGKIGIFSGSVNGTATKSTKYYIFDPATLTRSPSKTIPTEHLPASISDTCTLRTSNGGAWVTRATTNDDSHFSEYNEALDSFSTFQMKLPGSYLNPQASNSSAIIAQDYVATEYGHLFFPTAANVKPFIALKSGLTPTYSYLRKS